MRDTLDVCCLCEDGGLLIICDGQCLRSFHLQCLGLDSMPSGNRWLCPDCDAKQHICLQCGEVGDDNTEGETGVFKCSVGSCGRFYHRAYVLLAAAAGVRTVYDARAAKLTWKDPC